MRILFVLENYLPHIGGVETVFMNLSESLARKGHTVSIVTHKIKGTQEFEVINNVIIYRIDCFESRYLFTFFSIPKVLSLAREVDIIHTTTFNGGPPAWLASKLLRKPCVITIHEVWIDKWRELTDLGPLSAILHNFLEKMIYRLNFDKYVCVSNFTRTELQKIVNKSKTMTIYNGVDYSHWDPKNYDGEKIRRKLKIKDDFVILCYGRPGVSKGIQYMINAMPQILKKIPKSKLLLILSKDLAYKKKYDEIIRLIHYLDLDNDIILQNAIPYKELPNYHKASDCVVVPSLSEGFGFNAAETCAMEKPVVVSNVASLPEVVWGKHILVEPKSPKKIGEGVIKIYNGQCNYTKKKIFSWKKNVDSHLKVYNELLGNLNKS